MKRKCRWGVEWRCSLPGGKVIKGVHSFTEAEWVARKIANEYNDKYITKYGEKVFIHKPVRIERKFE